MSIQFMDSFDDRDTAHLKDKAITDFADGAIVPGCGQCGTNGFRDPSIGDGMQYGYALDSSDRMQIGVAFYNDSASGASASIGTRTTAAVAKAFWQLEGATEIHFWTGPNGILGTDHGFGTAPLATWTYIELQVFFHDTLGTVKGYINGTLVVDVSGFDTIEFWSGTEKAGTATIHCAGGGNTCMDDFYVMNGDGAAPRNATVSIGPAHVIAMTPFDDGDARGWQPSSGSDHFAMVNEIPPEDDANYVSSSQEGAQDLYEFLDVVLPSETVYAVQRGFHVRSTSTKLSEVSHLDKVGSGIQRETERWGIQYPDWFYDSQIDDLQPNGSPWNLTAFNSAQFGMKHYTSRSESVGFPE